MSTNPYANLDARFAESLANAIHDGSVSFASLQVEGELSSVSAIEARLRGIAQRIEANDAKLARHLDGTFEQGKGFAELRARERSNVLRPSRHVTNEDGETLIAALAAQGKSVKRAKPGESGLKAKPQAIALPAQSAAARKGWRLGDL